MLAKRKKPGIGGGRKDGHSLLDGKGMHIREYKCELERREKRLQEAIDDQIEQFQTLHG